MFALVKKCIVWTNLGQLRQQGCTCISRDHVNYLEMVKGSLIHIKHALAIAMCSGTKARHGCGHGHQACVCTRAYSTGGFKHKEEKRLHVGSLLKQSLSYFLYEIIATKEVQYSLHHTRIDLTLGY